MLVLWLCMLTVWLLDLIQHGPLLILSMCLCSKMRDLLRSQILTISERVIEVRCMMLIQCLLALRL